MSALRLTGLTLPPGAVIRLGSLSHASAVARLRGRDGGALCGANVPQTWPGRPVLHLISPRGQPAVLGCVRALVRHSGVRTLPSRSCSYARTRERAHPNDRSRQALRGPSTQKPTFAKTDRCKDFERTPPTPLQRTIGGTCACLKERGKRSARTARPALRRHFEALPLLHLPQASGPNRQAAVDPDRTV
jgi:hypothetical protein